MVKISVISAVNDTDVLDFNLMKSSIFNDDDVEFIPLKGFDTVSLAYNKGVELAKGDILIFVHQDVYLPVGWRSRLETSLSEIGSNWGVLGLVGVDAENEIVGNSWSNGMQREIGFSVVNPVLTYSVDELLFVLNKKNNLLFDEGLPGWHLHGTDIVQLSIKYGFPAYVINAPVIHNSLPVIQFDKNFRSCYRYMRSKWMSDLPLKTCCTEITYWGYPIVKRHLKQMLKNNNRGIRNRDVCPKEKAVEIGYE